MHGHVIICGVTPGIAGLLAPMRSRFFSRVVPIVIVDEVMPEKEWTSISVYAAVYFVRGSPQNWDVLYAAGIETAAKVLRSLCLS
jgi:hypothetical protein